ncbi:MAG: hypothetical protein ABI461_08735 [Polyangiaceae bacterium]
MNKLLGAVVVCMTMLGTLNCGSGNPSSATTPPTGASSATVVIPSSSASAAASAPVAAAPIDAGSAASDPQDAMCGGTDIDLAAVLANKQCRAGRDAPATPVNAATDVKVTLKSSDAKIAPGGHVELVVEITNTSSAPIPLYFSGDLTLAVEVKDAKGTRLAPPAGNAPKNADPKCMDKDCRHPESHIVLAAGGRAHAKVGFDAVKAAWPKTGPTTCCTVHVDAVPGAKLAAGTYSVKIPLPYESNQGNPADPVVTIQVGK